LEARFRQSAHPRAILKDGAEYYMTFSSFDSYPGLTIRHSRDLVNWQPRRAALTKNIGSVWAVSLEKHNGHMVIAARSRSIHGPWEQPPRNPLVRTTRTDEKGWSRGHASLVEAPDGQWWAVYHGFENGY
jgi:beta-xylosidase